MRCNRQLINDAQQLFVNVADDAVHQFWSQLNAWRVHAQQKGMKLLTSNLHTLTLSLC